MKSFIRKTRRSVKSLGRSQKGFTLIEVLVVVAILGVLAAVAVPQVSKFINTGDEAAADVELRDVQLAVTALLADCEVPQIDAAQAGISDMALITAGSGAHTAAEYMTGLSGTSVQSGETYNVTLEGVVTQN